VGFLVSRTAASIRCSSRGFRGLSGVCALDGGPGTMHGASPGGRRSGHCHARALASRVGPDPRAALVACVVLAYCHCDRLWILGPPGLIAARYCRLVFAVPINRDVGSVEGPCLDPGLAWQKVRALAVGRAIAAMAEHSGGSGWFLEARPSGI